jgi:serine/threonine protein kinase
MSQGFLDEGDILKERFVLEERIGAGGMGVVYKARDLCREEAGDRHPFVAVKVLAEDLKQYPHSWKALHQEACKALRLAHPNIVTVYDFDRDGHTAFMTMEYLEGEPLSEILEREGAQGLEVAKALPLIEAMGHALAYAHQHDLVHADLKPSNVFITRQGRVKVLDFGIARAVRRPEQHALEETRTRPVFSDALTPGYASCEMLEGAAPDPRDDIYSLACVVYELLTGRHPFSWLKAVKARELRLAPAPIRGLSRRQWRGLRRGLAFQREDRTPTVEVFLSELRQRQTLPWGVALVAGVSLLFLVGIYLGPLPSSPGPEEDQLATAEENRGPEKEEGEKRIQQQFNVLKKDFKVALAQIGSSPVQEEKALERADEAREILTKLSTLAPDDPLITEGRSQVANRLATATLKLAQAGRREEAFWLANESLKRLPEAAILNNIRDWLIKQRLDEQVRVHKQALEGLLNHPRPKSSQWRRAVKKEFEALERLQPWEGDAPWLNRMHRRYKEKQAQQRPSGEQNDGKNLSNSTVETRRSDSPIPEKAKEVPQKPLDEQNAGKGISSSRVKIQHASSTPEKVKVGDTVMIVTDYSVMAPAAIKQVEVEESWLLKKKGETRPILKFGPRHRSISGRDVVKFSTIVPPGTKPGAYIIEHKIQTGIDCDPELDLDCDCDVEPGCDEEQSYFVVIK